MSSPSKKPRKKKKPIDPKKLLEMPDDQAIRKLFPPKLIDKIDEEIDHARHPKKTT